MTSNSPAQLNLMLIDDDLTFRQGFVACLNQYTDLQVVLEADPNVAVQTLQDWFDAAMMGAATSRRLDLIILGFQSQSAGRNAATIALCKALQNQYPTIPILAIGPKPTPTLVSTLRQAGASGYCQKGAVVADCVQIIRRVAAGNSDWPFDLEVAPPALIPTPASGTLATTPLKPIARIRRNLHQSGLSQIDAAIAQINVQLSGANVTELDRVFLTGRRRELRAARWLVTRLLTTAEERSQPTQPLEPPPSTSASSPSPIPPPSVMGSGEPPRSPQSQTNADPASTIVLQQDSTALRSLQASLFDTTFAKLQFGLRNLTETPLEIDILRDEKKRELLSLVLRKLEEILDDLRFSQVAIALLPDKTPGILLDLWQATLEDFFGRYYTLPLGCSATEQLLQKPIEMVDVLLQDAPIVQTEILNKIPLVPDFLAHLLFQTPLIIDDTTCNLGTVDAMARMEALLQNLMIQVANAVVQPLLNRFGDVIAIKQTFYDRRLLSSREIERFRNNLSWKYRVDRYFGEPTAIFESRYPLLMLQDQGIVKRSIYFPRNQELDELSGVRLAVTLALEARDAISPRLRTAIAFVGSGVVYVLTEVIGRGIGLIGRGVIKGVGNVAQEVKFNRNGERSR